MLQTLLGIVGYAALAAALGAPLAYVSGGIELGACKETMLVATLVWFAVSGKGLMGKDSQAGSEPAS